MEVIRVENLVKKYGETTVLNNISFSIDKGDFFFIVGENGSGKTTLMKILLGLIRENSGKIVYSGFSKNEIGYLPQQSENQSDFPASVGEVVLSGFLNHAGFFPYYKKENKLKARQIMESMGIEHLKNKSFGELSGGQKQKVLLSRALCASKGVLLLDEPQSNLDPVAAAELYELIEDLKSRGTTLIMISHDVECAVKYSTKILHLSDGEFFLGTPSEYMLSDFGKKMLEEGHHHA